MTLPLRKKHLTTAKSTSRRVTVTRATETGRSWLTKALRAVLLSGSALGVAATLGPVASAQQTGWQPTRMPSQTDARPLKVSAQTSASQANQGTGQNSGVVLRWKSVSSSPAPAGSAAVSSTMGSNSTHTEAAIEDTRANMPSGSLRTVQPAAAQSKGSPTPMVSPASGWTANPLRGDRGVRPANYQQQPANPQGSQLGDPFGDSQLPLPGGVAPALPPSNMPALPPSQQLPKDPLSNTELPPAPGGEEVQAEPISPFDRQANPKSDPFGDKEKAPDEANSENSDRAGDGKRQDLKMPKLKKNANITSCNDLRDRVRQMRLSDISLDVSPEFGEGLRARESGAKARLDFAASAPIRDWTDYTGTIVATGRLVDLRDDRVVLDVNGREQLVPVRDLSDVDVAYVADVWNLPMQCGIGYEAYAGRQFIPSAVEWKASGLCHKPLYFEDVQLERYGHEVGPVLQPLLSSAHFFGNMLILPYKMGIHPPGECQYPLGYYRPGDCAPYMIQPFPFSLRGAAVQAGFVTGAGALIP